MENLEQLRAAAALAPARNLDRSAISKLPALILSNGLLATTAFCCDGGGGDGKTQMKNALDATARHLAARGILAANITSADQIIPDLRPGDACKLQRATTEALAFLGYLKRFAPKRE